MPDITMCNNDACPSKTSCYRYTAVPSEYRQSWASFTLDEGGYKCSEFVQDARRPVLRRCSKCRVTKPESDFTRSGIKGRHCNTCAVGAYKLKAGRCSAKCMAAMRAKIAGIATPEFSISDVSKARYSQAYYAVKALERDGEVAFSRKIFNGKSSTHYFKKTELFKEVE